MITTDTQKVTIDDVMKAVKAGPREHSDRVIFAYLGQWSGTVAAELNNLAVDDLCEVYEIFEADRNHPVCFAEAISFGRAMLENFIWRMYSALDENSKAAVGR
ncbi:MAG: hypothetical protein HQK58_11340 [Deltaproteobacteria bacterium]|nr:hypothetical protein [Deltaproteobacteria bacterium]